MKEIVLTQNKVALVDDDDYNWLSRWRWHACRYGGLWYAMRNSRENGKWRKILMHRVILGDKVAEITDHKDRNGLNNQRSNLRPCTRSQNTANSQRKSRAGFKGVEQKSRNRWRAMIGIKEGRKNLGSFKSPEEAAKAYDEAAIERYGEFAILNFGVMKCR